MPHSPTEFFNSPSRRGFRRDVAPHQSSGFLAATASSLHEAVALGGSTGQGATELIHIGQTAMAFNGTIDYFIENTFNYPTLAECYRVAGLNGYNKIAVAG